MPTEEQIPPEPHLMESLRAVGYTLEAALADVLDNSITAQSRQIDIVFNSDPDDFVAILDDGHGMTRDEAREAMRLAGRNVVGHRAPDDLGRFGLGLKTASLSQCRNLTLVTKTEHAVVGYSWDLDHLARTTAWSLLSLTKQEIDELPLAESLQGRPSGTLVVWRKLDYLRAQVGPTSEDLDRSMISVRDHLGLIYHRFLDDPESPLTLRLNGRLIPSTDPFFSMNRKTQRLPAETFRVQDATVHVQPFTIPRLATLTHSEQRSLQSQGQLRESQGFYIYRAKRLVIWGTWFRILPKQDMSKLTRVRVDIPNTLDHLWALDIKKATAQPPPEVRARLRKFAERVTQPSRKTLTYQGRTVQDTIDHVWRIIDNDTTFHYKINREHPAVLAVAQAADSHCEEELARLLNILEGTIPSDDIFNRLAADRTLERPLDETDLASLADDAWNIFRENAGPTATPEMFVEAMSSLEPFAGHPSCRTILKGATHVN